MFRENISHGNACMSVLNRRKDNQGRGGGRKGEPETSSTHSAHQHYSQKLQQGPSTRGIRQLELAE